MEQAVHLYYARGFVTPPPVRRNIGKPEVKGFSTPTPVRKTLTTPEVPKQRGNVPENSSQAVSMFCYLLFVNILNSENHHFSYHIKYL